MHIVNILYLKLFCRYLSVCYIIKIIYLKSLLNHIGHVWCVPSIVKSHTCIHFFSISCHWWWTVMAHKSELNLTSSSSHRFTVYLISKLSGQEVLIDQRKSYPPFEVKMPSPCTPFTIIMFALDESSTIKFSDLSNCLGSPEEDHQPNVAPNLGLAILMPPG